ncbi:MAG: ABC transporter transmembrane domain-containing protein, partial [Cyanobacteria bacterium P01_E01_bin.45]
MSFLRKFLYVFSGRTNQLVGLLMVFLVTSLLEAFGIGMIGPFLTVAGQPELARNNGFLSGVSARLGLETDSQLVILLGLFIICVFVIKSVVFLFGKYYTYRTLFDQRAAVRLRLFRSYLTSPYEFHINRNSSEFVNRIVTEAQRFSNLVAVPLAETCSNAIVIAILVGLLAVTDITLFLLSVGTLLPAFLCFFFLSKRIKDWGIVAGQAREQTIKAVGHGLGGLKETRVLGCEDYFQQDLGKTLARESRMDTRFSSALFIPRTLIEAVMMIAVVGFVCISQFFLEQDFQAAISSMGVFAVTALRLIPACSQMVQALGRMRNSTFTLDSLYHDLKEVSECDRDVAASTPQSSRPLTFKHDLVLQSLVYRYP